MTMSETRIDVLLLNEKDMLEAGVLDAGKCVDTLKDVMVLLSNGDFLMGGKNKNGHGMMLTFPKESEIEGFPLDSARDRRFMAMPGYLGGRFHKAGQKWYGSNGDNREKGLPRSILMFTLNDVDTGAPLAYMSANLLSAMRTGAMPGLAAEILAKPDSKVLALVGAGVVNRACLMAIMSKFDIEEIRIKGSSTTSKTTVELADFARKTYPAAKVIISETLSECLQGADIVSEGVSCIFGEHPILDGADIKPGAVVISSGNMAFSDEYTAKFSKVLDNLHMYEEYQEVLPVFDDKGNFIRYSIVGLQFANLCTVGQMNPADIRHIGDIITGKVPGRTSDDEIFYVGVGGNPLLDIGWGSEVYASALEKGIGTKWNLWEAPFLR